MCVFGGGELGSQPIKDKPLAILARKEKNEKKFYRLKLENIRKIHLW